MIVLFKRLGIILLIIGILSSCSSDPESVVSRKTNIDLELKVDQYLNDKQFNGSILIAKEGNIWISKGYGMANFEKKIANTPNTVFRIGSMTKQFTALSIMELQEHGLVNVKDTLDKYIPDYPAGDKITLHQLLSHTSGIPEYLTVENITVCEQPISPIEIIELFKDQPLLFTPGTQFSYSNSNYILLGYIIEQVSNESYEQYINKHIFSPLYMKNSGYDKNDYNENTHAKGYAGTVLQPTSPALNIDLSAAYSAGALYSTVEDLFLWDQALYTDTIISEKSLNTIFTSNIGIEHQKAGYGYGWIVYNGPENLVGHNGRIPGYFSTILKNRRTRNLIIVLSNFDSNFEIDLIANDLNTMLDEFIK